MDGGDAPDSRDSRDHRARPRGVARAAYEAVTELSGAEAMTALMLAEMRASRGAVADLRPSRRCAWSVSARRALRRRGSAASWNRRAAPRTPP